MCFISKKWSSQVNKKGNQHSYKVTRQIQIICIRFNPLFHVLFSNKRAKWRVVLEEHQPTMSILYARARCNVIRCWWLVTDCIDVVTRFQNAHQSGIKRTASSSIRSELVWLRYPNTILFKSDSETNLFVKIEEEKRKLKRVCFISPIIRSLTCATNILFSIKNNSGLQLQRLFDSEKYSFEISDLDH